MIYISFDELIYAKFVLNRNRTRNVIYYKRTQIPNQLKSNQTDFDFDLLLQFIKQFMHVAF